MAEHTDEQGALCPECKHRVKWHHDERGCDYHGAGPHACPCMLTSDAVVERILTERLAARLTPWEVLRRAAQTVTGSEREWLLMQADGWEASGLTDRPAEQPDDEVHQWLRSRGDSLMAEPADEQAVRDPRRGKAHRQEAGTTVYGPRRSRTGLTVCQREMWNMTERVPAASTAPEDRCLRCFPRTRPGEEG